MPTAGSTHSWTSSRPLTLWVLIVFAVIQVIAATGGGIGLVQDPVDNIGMPLSMLEGSPFDDYLFPGLILLLVVGLFPIIPLVGMIMRRRWAWWLELASGLGLIIWVIVEAAMLGYLPGTGIALQIIMGLLGLVIVVLTLAPKTRRYFRIGRRA